MDILLSIIGSQTYDLLKKLYTPDNLNTISFEDILTKLAEHLEPKQTIIAERYRLHQREKKYSRAEHKEWNKQQKTTSRILLPL